MNKSTFLISHHFFNTRVLGITEHAVLPLFPRHLSTSSMLCCRKDSPYKYLLCTFWSGDQWCKYSRTAWGKITETSRFPSQTVSILWIRVKLSSIFGCLIFQCLPACLFFGTDKTACFSVQYIDQSAFEHISDTVSILKAVVSQVCSVYWVS